MATELQTSIELWQLDPNTAPHHHECEIIGYGICTCEEYYERDIYDEALGG